MQTIPQACFSSRRQIGFRESGTGPAELPSEDIQFGNDVRTTLKIRVVIADDHSVMREGLSQLITKEPDMEVIGQASNGEEAVEVTLHVQPDVVLMDVTMPVLDGVEATRQIISQLPGICVIGLSVDEDPVIEREMKLAGASAHLTKSCRTEVLMDAIRNCSFARR